MKHTVLLIFIVLVSAVSFAQTAVDGGVKVQGSCNQVVTGSGNQITLNCNGVTKEKAAQLVRLLNTILSRQLDPEQVYAQLNQIKSQVNKLDVAVNPMGAMPSSEQEMFESARRLVSDCMQFHSQWMLGGLNRRTQALSSGDRAAAMQAGQSQNDLNATQIARYQKDFAPKLIQLRTQLLALQPSATPASSPDYAAVKSPQDLGFVCTDFSQLGTNVYMAETQRVRNQKPD